MYNNVYDTLLFWSLIWHVFFQKRKNPKYTNILTKAFYNKKVLVLSLMYTTLQSLYYENKQYSALKTFKKPIHVL